VPAAPVEADMIRGAHDDLAAFQVRNSKVKNGRAEPPLLHRRKIDDALNLLVTCGD
jgi:hypothetical protein